MAKITSIETVSSDELAEYLGVSKRTLENWRRRKNAGPNFYYAGREARYRTDWIHEWERSTSRDGMAHAS